MKKTLFSIVISLLFCSCMPPSVSRMIMKTYPPKDATTVAVYFNKPEVPSSSESLGVVSVFDGGMSTNCDSVSVVNIIKAEAGKAGGNAAYVSEHVKPSFWGSTCHQMTATLLRVYDFSGQDTTATAVNQSAIPDLRRIKPERKLPSMNADLKLGYGYRTAKASDDLDEFQSYVLNKRKSGLSVEASFQYYFNDFSGIGFMYSGFNSWFSIPATYEINNNTLSGIMTTRDRIDFFGPKYIVRLPLSDKFFVNMAVALGYVMYNAKENFSTDYYYTAKGVTVGLYYGADMEYKFSKHLAATLGVGWMSASLSDFEIDNNGQREFVDLMYEQGVREGVGFCNFALGLRYHF